MSGVPLTYVTSTDGYYPEFRSRRATHIALTVAEHEAMEAVVAAARGDYYVDYGTDDLKHALAALDATRAKEAR